jgi:S-ribosylhomocysteine lyase LuxS involved in autoinducer biosynthesis
MPKFGTHLLISDVVYKNQFNVPKSDQVNARRLGAIGPDMTLFMFDPVGNNQPYVRKGFKLTLEMMEELDKIKDALQKLTSEITASKSDLANWVSGGMNEQLGNLLNLSLGAIVSTLKLGLADGTSGLNLNNPLFELFQSNPPAALTKILNPDFLKPKLLVDSFDNYGFPFRYFGHPYTDDGTWKQKYPPGDYRNWWWMDLLHYRKTGQFTTQLFKNANNQVTRAYAEGYLTHYAGDICGHPFINALVGGPFRNHAYRHLVLESLADTWLWNNQKRGDIADGHLDEFIELSDQALNDVTSLILKTMKDTYKGDMVPSLLRKQAGYPTTDELKTAYQTLKQYLKRATSLGYKRPEPPRGGFGEVLSDMRELLNRNRPTAPPSLSGKTGLEFLSAFLGWAMRGITWLAMIATAQPALVIRLINQNSAAWIIYALEQAVYFILSGVRTLLCLMGWGYASKDDFENFGFLEDWVTAQQYRTRPERYPRGSSLRPKQPYFWLFDPERISEHELPGTLAFPMQDNPPLKPNWLLDQTNNRFQREAEGFFRAKNPLQSIAVEGSIAFETGFGNPIEFTKLMQKKLMQKTPLPDLDLDGDRGYGFGTWESEDSKVDYIK